MCAAARSRIGRILAVAVSCVYLNSGQYARAGIIYDLTITHEPPSGAAYDGKWRFDVMLNEMKDMLILTVISGNSDLQTNKWKGVMYSFPVTKTDKGAYTFSGTSLGSRAPKPPPNSDYNLGVSGVFTPSTRGLTIDDPVTSQRKDGTGPV